MLVTSCALCKSDTLSLILDLGFHPLADSFLKKEELLQSEATYPLQVFMCQSCGHAMNSYVVPPTKRYQDHDYSYDSSNSKVSIEHFKEMAGDVAKRIGVTKGDLVVDIGSSVGTLLQAFKDQTGANILGVEPAHNIAALADKNNIPTVHDFWNDNAAEEVLKIGKAKAITITNAFNHIGDVDAFMRNIVRTLAPDGALVIEAPYLLHLVEKLAFDTIYLEHVSYFAIKPLTEYFKKFDMVITDILENDYMGGSMRLYVQFGTQLCPLVEKNIERENSAQLYELATYVDLSARMRQFKYTLVKQLLDARLAGGVVIGIGAPAKGNTLLNYCGIDATLLDFITDASPLKINKYTPGSHIPILPDEAITDTVTHALILPWNIAEFLKGKLAPKYPKISFIIPHMQ
ncbi:class I SAM-dependent methyltransferase [Candidatus Kaiserbacteria bacterium]|nr:class I SAM-dependent methyltransferase [Candidatus Kaiserbacteria bacterium]